MPSTSPPHLSLVSPPPVSVGEPGDFGSMLEQALRSDGWRSVCLLELRCLPRDANLVLHGIEIEGKMTYWIKEVSAAPVLTLIQGGLAGPSTL